MKIDPEILNLLLESMNEGIREISDLLAGTTDQDTVSALARIAHKLKGEATVVGLVSLSRLIVKLENILERMSQMRKVDKAHLLVVARHLRKIVQVCERLRKNALDSEKVKATSKKVEKKPTVNNSVRARGVGAALKILAMNVSRSCDKQVTLKLDNFKLADVPNQYQAKIQDIVIQLLRNAIAHGIESPEARKQRGKSAVGTVAVMTKRTEKGLVIAVRDNGRGIDLDQVRKRLILKYDHDVMSVAKLSKQSLLSTLFLPGFSTLEKQAEHAGRGVGLDLVKHHTQSLGGKVHVSFEANRYTQFVVEIPLKASAKVTPLRKQKPIVERKTSGEIPPILVDIA